jgi:hypothetical protein
MSIPSETEKKEERLKSKGEQVSEDQLSKGAESEREKSSKRPRTGA